MLLLSNTHMMSADIERKQADSGFFGFCSDAQVFYWTPYSVVGQAQVPLHRNVWCNCALDDTSAN